VLRADRVSSCPEERAQNSDGPVVRFGCARVRGTGGRVVAKRSIPCFLSGLLNSGGGIELRSRTHAGAGDRVVRGDTCMCVGACGGERLEGSSPTSVVDTALRFTWTRSPSDRTGKPNQVSPGGHLVTWCRSGWSFGRDWVSV